MTGTKATHMKNHHCKLRRSSTRTTCPPPAADGHTAAEQAARALGTAQLPAAHHSAGCSTFSSGSTRLRHDREKAVLGHAGRGGAGSRGLGHKQLQELSELTVSRSWLAVVRTECPPQELAWAGLHMATLPPEKGKGETRDLGASLTLCPRHRAGTWQQGLRCGRHEA